MNPLGTPTPLEIPDLHDVGDPTLIDADAAVVVRLNGDTGELVYAKSVDTVHHQASLAKLMTALLAVTPTADLDQQVTVATADLRRGSGNVFSNGDTLSLHDLLQALLIPSSNTAAEALARTLGPKEEAGNATGGSRETFIEAMNARAAELGLASTQFANPSGLHDPAAASTARDVLRLLVEVMRHPVLVDILGRRVTHLRIGGPHERLRRVTTSVHALDRLDVIAGKTGTLRSGDGHFHLGAIADLDEGEKVLLVLMGAHGQAGRDRDTDALLEHLRPASAQTRYPGKAHRGQATRLDATELADLVDGTWVGTPSPDWVLRELRNVQSARRARTANGLLTVVRRAGSGLRWLNDSSLSPESVCVLTESVINEDHPRFPVLQVPSIDEALHAITQRHRQQYRGTVIAVTGPDEARTIAVFLGSVLSHRYRAKSPPHSVGDPLRSIQQQMVDLRTEPLAVFELDPQVPGTAAQLVDPDVLVVTGTPTGDDGGTTADDEAAETVAQIVTGIRPDGTVVLNRDAPDADRVAGYVRRHARRILTYGSHPEADVRLLQHTTDNGRIRVDVQRRGMDFQLSTVVASNISTSLAVLAVLQVLGEDTGAFTAPFELLPPGQNAQGRRRDNEAATHPEPRPTRRVWRSRRAGSTIPSVDTTDRDFESADTAAEIVGGEWIGSPPPDWRLEKLLRVRSAKRTNAQQRNVLVPVANPDRALTGLERSALDSTAAALLVDADIPVESTRFAALRVTSVKDAVTALAARRRQPFPGKVIAVTGSIGKTTTKIMIGSALSQVHETFWRPDNSNGLNAVQNQCFELDQQRYMVVEIARIGLPEGALLIRPDVAIVTGIAEAHAEDLGTLEQIAQTKAQIFTGMNPSGTAVLNRDAPHADLLLEAANAHAARVITYGTSPDADARLLAYDPRTELVSVDLLGASMQYRVGTPGAHNALNSLAALCAIYAVGEDASRLAGTLEAVKLATGRGDTSQMSIAGRHITLVDQSYNANPASMRAALEVFATHFADSRRVLVLGDMRELGPTEATLHAELLEPVMEAAPERVYLVGPLMAHLWNKLPEQVRGAHLSTTAQLRAVLEIDLRDGDIVLMKASRDTGLKKFVASLNNEQAEGSESWRVTVRGPAVHKVGYRRWLRRRALQHGLDGWVRNSADGKVEALLRGRKRNLGAVYSLLHAGPPKADVHRVTTRRVSTVPSKGLRLRQTPPPRPSQTPPRRSPARRFRSLAKRVASRLRSKRLGAKA